MTKRTQLDKYTTPCLNIPTNSLLSNSNSNTDLMDARCDPIQHSLENNITKLESNNLINSDHVLPLTRKIFAVNWTTAQASENNDVTQESDQTLDDATTISDS